MGAGRDPRTYTLRHFFFYLGVMGLLGAAISEASYLMSWSIGVVYAVGLTMGTLIAIFAFRESLFAPPGEPAEKHRRRHPSPR